MITDFLQYYQPIVESQFELLKRKYKHTGNKGFHAELILRNFLNEFLPSHLRAGHGETVDSYGKNSTQTDIIIADSTLQPLVNNYDVSNKFIIEAVTCAGEVKSDLRQLEKGFLMPCKAFKSLSPRFSEHDRIVSNTSDIERFYKKRPFFGFAFKAGLKIETIMSKLTEFYKDVPIPEQIDAIFILNEGVIINFGDGNGAFKYVNSENGESYKGFIQFPDGNEVLKTFIKWLTATMPKMVWASNPLLHYIFK